MNSFYPSNSLNNLKFDNSFTRNLPGDPIEENYCRQVQDSCYSRVQPTMVAQPKLVSYSRETASLLDLSPATCESESFLEIFAGNKLTAGMEPFAMCYGGHQFGSWAGQLGDGRAINLGEIINNEGKRWALQLKGAGLTPYSRQADGLAVLRSSIREFLCSEAMHHLGIPTTRALSVVETGEPVVRDMFYDGHPKNEPGAIVCRVSPSFLRFGNFEILASRQKSALLKKLVDYTIRTDFPELGDPSVAVYGQWFTEICRRTAELILHWMRVGFVHGVMNTDNMSILGLTIDYGPYGWLEGYEANWTPNTTDALGRRYAFGNQPHIGQWNLVRLADTLAPLFTEVDPLQQGLDLYTSMFQRGWNEMMARKIGLLEYHGAADNTLLGELINLLQATETDMTIFFRNLAKVNSDTEPALTETSPLAAAYYSNTISDSYREKMSAWLKQYACRVRQDGRSDEDRQMRMNLVNPKYVLRNYLAQMAIDKAENGDYTIVDELLELLRHPYDEQPEKELLATKRPEWARNRAGCSMLSCSS
jgi:uncharacterized protein YdiU (UPF0061 family)